MTSLLDVARSYAAVDLHVFPCLPRCKAPDGQLVPHGVKEATIDSALIRRWWNRSPEANIGIAIGVGALFGVRILDVDPKNGGDRELRRLVARHGDLPATPTQRSGSGGLHVLFRWPSGDYKTKLVSGVEVLGPGRYFVAAPSIHPLTGRAYEWTVPYTTTIAPAPAWLLELARRRDLSPRAPGPRPAILGARYARGALISAISRLERAPAGDRNNALNREAFALSRFVRSGDLAESLVRRALVDAAGVAGLPAQEAHQTISSALRARKAQA
jgi:hypothetical protein